MPEPEPEPESPSPPPPSKDPKKTSTTDASAATAASRTCSRGSDAETSLLRLTRRHSLPASYHLSNFLSFFNTGSSSERAPISSNVHESQSNPQPAQPQIDISTTRHSRSATVSSQPASATSVNRHRYGHQQNKSVVLDQPVVVRTYNPPATPGFPTRAGMMNPAIFEVCSTSLPAASAHWAQEREVQRIELPPIEAFSFDGIVRAVNPEGMPPVPRPHNYIWSSSLM